MIKTRELGVLLVDAGDIVCFSKDDLLILAATMGTSYEALVQRFNGIACELNANGGYGVESIEMVGESGKREVIVIGGGDDFAQFVANELYPSGDEETKHEDNGDTRSSIESVGLATV